MSSYESIFKLNWNTASGTVQKRYSIDARVCQSIDVRSYASCAFSRTHSQEAEALGTGLDEGLKILLYKEVRAVTVSTRRVECI